MDSEEAIKTMEDAIHKEEQEEKAKKAISAARAALCLGYVRKGKRDPTAFLFSTIACHLETQLNWGIPTACTDGKSIYYNPSFVNSLKDEELVFLVAHECLHPLSKHHVRMGGRNKNRSNEAMDLAINQILRDSGYALTDGALLPGMRVGGKVVPRYAKLPPNESFEKYYSLLPDEPRGDDWNVGGVTQPGDGSDAACQESDAAWSVKIAQAAALARKMGTLPGSLEKLLGDIMNPQVDWRQVLREFLINNAKNDQTWCPPNRRFVHADMYLPSLRGVEIGDVVVAIDTSGSVWSVVDKFASEIYGIVSAVRCKLWIMYADAAVHKVDEWEPDDGEPEIKPVGGGGTSHKPVFRWVAENDVNPCCMICLTDCETDYPAEEPPYPVLWVRVGGGGTTPPFGQIIDIKE